MKNKIKKIDNFYVNSLINLQLGYFAAYDDFVKSARLAAGFGEFADKIIRDNNKIFEFKQKVTSLIETINNEIMKIDNKNIAYNKKEFESFVESFKFQTRKELSDAESFDFFESKPKIKKDPEILFDQNNSLLVNEKLLRNFKRFDKNIIFYDSVNSGRILQLLHNASHYFSINNKKVNFYFVDNLEQELDETSRPSYWGWEKEAIRNCTSNFFKKIKKEDDDIKNSRNYIVIRNFSNAKNYGNNSQKFGNSALDTIIQMNSQKFDNIEIRFILVEDESGFSEISSMRRIKKTSHWDFVKGKSLESDKKTILSLVANQIQIDFQQKSALKINISLNDEEMNLINEINDELKMGETKSISLLHDIVKDFVSDLSDNDLFDVYSNEKINKIRNGFVELKTLYTRIKSKLEQIIIDFKSIIIKNYQFFNKIVKNENLDSIKKLKSSDFYIKRMEKVRKTQNLVSKVNPQANMYKSQRDVINLFVNKKIIKMQGNNLVVIDEELKIMMLQAAEMMALLNDRDNRLPNYWINNVNDLIDRNFDLVNKQLMTKKNYEKVNFVDMFFKEFKNFFNQNFEKNEIQWYLKSKETLISEFKELISLIKKNQNEWPKVSKLNNDHSNRLLVNDSFDELSDNDCVGNYLASLGAEKSDKSKVVFNDKFNLEETTETTLHKKLIKFDQKYKNDIIDLKNKLNYSSWDYSKFDENYEDFLGLNNRCFSEFGDKTLSLELQKIKGKQENLSIEITQDLIFKWAKNKFDNLTFSFEERYRTKNFTDFVNKIKSLPSFIKKTIIGQDKQIDEITKPLLNRFMLETNKDKPWMSYLFVGPTGVGKTKVAQLISEKLFNKNKTLIINMSEYNTPHKSLLDANDNLSKYISSNPQSIIVFDEIEKANTQTQDYLLQILSTANLVNSDNVNLSFKHALIICTTNLCASLFEYKRISHKGIWQKAASVHFRPEIIGRFDDIILFNALDNKNLEQIFLNKLHTKIKEIFKAKKWNIFYEIDDSVLDLFKKESDLEQKGARSIEGLINKQIMSKLANVLAEVEINKVKKIKILFKKQQVEIEAKYE